MQSLHYDNRIHPLQNAQVLQAKHGRKNQILQQWFQLLQFWIFTCADELSFTAFPFGSRKYDLWRICDDDHSPEMTCLVAEAVCHSSQPEFRTIALSILQLHPFVSPVEAYSAISFANSPKSSSLCLSNFQKSIQHLHILHQMSSQLLQIRETHFSYDHPRHIQYLDRLWHAAFPLNIDFFEDWTERDWGRLGFQKKNDPASDFRGLGLLGLQQLVYFFETRGKRAKDVLSVAQKDTAYFPLAATALSVGAFTLGLLKEHRLHRKLLTALDTHQLLYSSRNENAQGIDQDLIERLDNICMEVYCDLMERFTELWQSEHAANVMDFTRVFTLLQQETRAKYEALHVKPPKVSSVGHATASIIQ